MEFFSTKLLWLTLLLALTTAQSLSSADPSGYTGYTLTLTGTDADSAVYETANTDTNGDTTALSPPDVFLNASLSVGEIAIDVANLSAQVNLEARVLNLLHFGAGVDVSVDRVALTIQNVSARVLLEARLSNLLLMVNETLNSIDLNPIIAQLGQGLGDIVDGVGDVVGGVTGDLAEGADAVVLDKRGAAFEHEDGILYSVSNYAGNTHTNRVLLQSGVIIDQALDNRGTVRGSTEVGTYLTDMTFTGGNSTVILGDGTVARALEYAYEPFRGLSVTCEIFVSIENGGGVVGTRVVAEASGGASSTIEADEVQEELKV